MACFLVHVALMVVLAYGTIGSSTALSLEQKLSEVESRLITKITLLQSKNTELEEKMTQMETQLEQNNEEREELALQVTELKAKVQQQETILFSLLNEKKEPLAHVNDLSSIYQSEVSVNGLPSSCADLKMIGHIWNGFYSVMGNTTMESVYCDFTKLTSDTGFQKWIGYMDVKSTPVHFYADRTSAFVRPSTGPPFVTFNNPRLNVGNAMDAYSGIFTAPRPGIYFFSFVTQAEFPASNSTLIVTTLLLKNGGEVERASIYETNTVAYQKSPLTLTSTLNLKSGDQMCVLLSNISPGVSLNGDGNPFTYFTGFLLEEEIVASL